MVSSDDPHPLYRQNQAAAERVAGPDAGSKPRCPLDTFYYRHPPLSGHPKLGVTHVFYSAGMDVSGGRNPLRQ